MANPLLQFFLRSARGAAEVSRHVDPATAELPVEPPSTDVVFLVLRRLRTPLIMSILVFSTSVFGLVLIPGVDEAGNRVRMSVFDAFYFISYTATTIGFGEIMPFTADQRMWVTATIFASVITWAYAIGTVLTLLQDPSFQEALRVQRFRRRVGAIREPFTIVAGYGLAGRQVCEQLDVEGMRFVVIDRDLKRLDMLTNSSAPIDAPYLHGDASQSLTLRLAGLGRPNCAGVLALTGEDETNLAVTMTATMLRPDVKVMARCVARIVHERMLDFSPSAVINAADRFGEYLLLAMRRPHVYQVLTWLMSTEGSALPDVPERLGEGRWVICGAGGYARHLSTDLAKAGLETVIADPAAGHPDTTGAAGFVAATPNDILNMALAEHVRHTDETVFIAVRQRTDANTATLRRMEVDSVFIPTDLIATETLARIVTPVFWDFVAYAFEQPDEWGAALIKRVKRACGSGTPDRELVTISPSQTPAVSHWLRERPLTLGELLRNPDDHTKNLHLVTLQLAREGLSQPLPDASTPLQEGDRLLIAGHRPALRALLDTLLHESTVHYVATGEQLPSTWLWRKIVLRHRARRATR